MTDTKTIAEMNQDIAEFMGYHFSAGKFYSNGPGRGKWFKEAKYYSDWNALMGAWLKVVQTKGEMGQLDGRHYHFYNNYYKQMKNAMITSDLPSAHKILWEAVNYLNKINDNGK